MIRINLIKPEPAAEAPERSSVPWILAALIAIAALSAIAFLHEERHREFREVMALVDDERASLEELIVDRGRLVELEAKRDIMLEGQARFDGLAARRGDLGAMVNDPSCDDGSRPCTS